MRIAKRNVDFNTTFTHFRGLMDRIFRYVNVQNIRLMDMYHDVYNMCNAQPVDFTEKLFAGIVTYLSEFTDSACNEIVCSSKLLECYAQSWKRFVCSCEALDKACEFLNKQIDRRRAALVGNKRPSLSLIGVTDDSHASTAPKASVLALGFLFWKDRVILEIKSQHSNLLVKSLIEEQMLWRKRSSSRVPVDVSILRTCIDSFISVDSGSGSTLLYEKELHQPFMDTIGDFFANEATECMSSNSVTRYLETAKRRLDQERELCAQYMVPKFAASFLHLFERYWVREFSEVIVANFAEFLSRKSYSSCTDAFDLLSLLEKGLAPLEEALQSQVTVQATTLIRDQVVPSYKQASDYVEPLLSLQQQSMKLCEDVFRKSSGFIAAVDKAFIATVNNASLTKAISSAYAPELLARYCDSLLRKPAKSSAALSEHTLERKMDAFVELFNYVDSKDVFQKLYSRLLAKRLINNNCISDDLEMAMIAKLKRATGFSYVHMLQRMFADLAVSNDMATVSDCPGFKPLVLTQGVWPIVATRYTMCGQVPPDFISATKPFEAFYAKKHDGRKLTWLHHLTKVDIRLTCFKKPYDLQLSIVQYQILKLISEVTDFELPVSSLLQNLGWSQSQLAKNCKPFLDLRLLELTTPTFTSSSILKFNFKFKYPKNKIKLVQLFGALNGNSSTSSSEFGSDKISGKGFNVEDDLFERATPTRAKEDSKLESIAVDDNESDIADAQREAIQDRSHFIQAVIVRVLKSQKSSTLNEIINKVLVQSQARFTPSISVIKKCVELLIEKGFLERSADNRDLFLYIS